MTATETITSNPRVLGRSAGYISAEVGRPGRNCRWNRGRGHCIYRASLYPQRKRRRQRLGSILEKYGTYEMNGIAFEDVNEIWWLETIGGHHWIARKVPDEVYVVMPNQLGIDIFDLEDALGDRKIICALRI